MEKIEKLISEGRYVYLAPESTGSGWCSYQIEGVLIELCLHILYIDQKTIMQALL